MLIRVQFLGIQLFFLKFAYTYIDKYIYIYIYIQDEKCARELADFLYTQALVMITDQIRVAEYSPIDNEGIVELLHAQGINMRYLGRLAVLAHESEKQDNDLHLTNRQRIQGMPFYWLEMIEIELLSRCFKHHLNELFQAHQEIKQQPARTIATLMNHLLGTYPKGHYDPLESLVNLNNYLNPNEVRVNGSVANASKNKKKNKNKNVMSDDYITCASVPQAPDWGGERNEFIRELQSIATSRFCHKHFFTMNLSPFESVHTDTVRVSRSKGPPSPTSTGEILSYLYFSSWSVCTILPVWRVASLYVIIIIKIIIIIMCGLYL
jgi:hypothetical protein